MPDTQPELDKALAAIAELDAPSPANSISTTCALMRQWELGHISDAEALIQLSQWQGQILLHMIAKETGDAEAGLKSISAVHAKPIT